MDRQLNWGIVGTGGIASDFATALRGSSRCRIVDVTGSSPAKGRAFADRWQIPSSADTLARMLENPAVEAIYIATPHPAHEAQALACIAARKHVLCEKPLTVDAASTQRVVDAARSAGVFLMEAYMYRCHPLMSEMIARLGDGAIGRLHHVSADFGFRASGARKGRLFERALGGGGILDIGGYPVSFARLVAGVVENAPFADPLHVHGSAVVGPTGVDELATAHLTFASGLTADVRCATRHDLGTTAVIYGEEGKIVLPNPWLPRGNRHGLESDLTVFRDGRSPKTITVRAPEDIYALEATLVADTLPNLEAAAPAMSLDDTLGNMRALDRWLAAITGVTEAPSRSPR